MYDLPFAWNLAIQMTRVLAASAFDLFLVGLGVVLFLRARGLVALRGMRWVGGAFALYGVTSLLAAIGWGLVALFHYDYTAMVVLGNGPGELLNVVISALGWVIDAVCIAMVVFGASAVARRLATPAPAAEAPAAAEDEDEDEVTDVRGLAVVR